MLVLENLHKTYGEKENAYEALKGVDLKIDNGESIAIIGKSGSGKSTMMHLLAGLDSPTSGDILLNERPYSSLKEKDRATLRNREFGFIFQQFFLQPNLSVLENVLLPLKIAKDGKKDRIRKARDILQKVGLSGKENKPAKTLSGGEKQRAAIARALVTNPQVIFADEPTGNLDTENGERVLSLMFDLQKERGNTLVIVTHDPDVARRCQRIIKINDGKIVA
jgi:putative ABC transport system ATP-binding protein